MDFPNGRYRARGVQAALGKTSKGGEQVAVEFQVYDAEGVPGESITWYGYFTEKTFERTIESLRLCGWTGNDLSDLSGVDANEVSLTIENEEYNGTTRSKVQWVNAPGAGLTLKEQLSPEEATSFAQRMKGRIVAMSANGARRPSAVQARNASALRPEPPPHADDDFPNF